MYAFGHDEVAPMSEQPLDPMNGWGASIIDAMDTMVRDIMHISCPVIVCVPPSSLMIPVHHGTHSMTIAIHLFVLQLNRLSRICLMNPSPLHKVLTSRNRKPPTLSGNNSAAQLTIFSSVLMRYCSVFESTIRYVGGLISAYELSGKQHFFLVQNAQRLADRLSLAWSQVRGYECAVRSRPQ